MVENSTKEKSSDTILILEPYYGGSHKAFLSGLLNLPLNLELMTLPARNWKWRMRLAAPYFAQMLHKNRQRYDRILCSSYVDVAAFRGIAPGWVREVPLLTYFHENQFAYPVQVDDERDVHFSLTNVTTALASDRLAFNSTYNLTSFLEGTERIMKHSPDLKLDHASSSINDKSTVLSPGIDFSFIDAEQDNKRNYAPVIVWNHRWEHDKNPELFFSTLFKLDEEGIDFQLIVLGQSFKNSPKIFKEAKIKLAHRILHFGYVSQKQDYARWLKKGDIVVSTANHEFFGIAVIEAVRAGCRPLLPNRLSYPELFPGEFLYSENEFMHRLKKEILTCKRLNQSQAVKLTNPFSWSTLEPAYNAWIME